jgi:homogentisate 1,2-dioxygenase
MEGNSLFLASFTHQEPNPNQLRWKPFDIPSAPTDFIEGIITICGAGTFDAVPKKKKEATF